MPALYTRWGAACALGLLLSTSSLMAQSTPLSQSLGDARQLRPAPGGFLLDTEGGQLRLQWYAPDVVRVSARRSTDADFPDASYAVVARLPEPAVAVRQQETDSTYTLRTDALQVVVYKNPVRLRFLTPDGRVVNEDEPGLGLRWLGESVAAHKKMQPGERFIGLGEKTGPLDRRGAAYVNWNTDEPAYATGADPLYVTIPFYLGVHGGLQYGIFFDNAHRSYFNFGASNDRFASFRAEAGALDYYFMYRPDVPGLLRAYTDLTGRMPMPPRWGLGYQQCRWSYFPDKEVLRIARTFREKQIPADVIYLDIHYMDAYKIFTWDKERFPDPDGMLRELRELGFQTTVIVDPGIKVEKGYESYETGLRDELFVKYPDGQPYTGEVWPGWCHFPDFTKPAARQWWGRSFEGYVRNGIRGFWNDMNEPATWGQQIPDIIEFDFDGRRGTHREAHNLYGLLMSRATYEGTRDLLGGERPLVLTRAAYAGIQRYSAVWTGDNAAYDDHMLLGVRLINSLGLSGVPFTGMDVGGFADEPSADLFARWISLGTFSPFFRTHTAFGTRAQEPWSFGENVEDIARRFIQLRYHLMPYLYSAFHEAAQTGLPVARSLAIAEPHNPQVYDHAFHNQFLFGPDLLVAPVSSRDRLARVYLPAGDWYHLYTEERFAGNQVVKVAAPLDQLPVFVRAGSVLPTQDLVQSLAEPTPDTLRLHVFAGTQGTTATHYEDDGTTYGYESGTYFRRTLRYDPARREIVLEASEGKGTSAYAHVQLVLHGFEAWNKPTLDGRRVTLETGNHALMPGGTAHPVRPLTFPHRAEVTRIKW